MAGGASRRLGQPKAMLPLLDGSVLSVTVNRLIALGIDTVVGFIQTLRRKLPRCLVLWSSTRGRTTGEQGASISALHTSMRR